MQQSHKVVFNTGILYARMMLSVGITLYTTRLILQALGTIEFGIFNLVAGVILFLSFINAAMTTSTQRYLSFYQGKNNLFMQKIIFSNSLFIHIVLGFLIVIFLFIIQGYLFNNIFNLPKDRLDTAIVVYQFMAFTVFFTVINVPFYASINAHEDMLFIAVVSLSEVMLKLLFALFLLKYYKGDKLCIYGLFIACISIFSFFQYFIFCLKKYKECSLIFHNYLNKKIMIRLTSFASWNLFGAVCGVSKSQGLAVVYNMFLGPSINAAYAIGNQVGGQMNFFSVAMLQALNPQIMKAEGIGNREKMLDLSMLACKYSFLLVAFIAIPCMFEMHTILSFWLFSVPNDTSIFCILIIVTIMIYQLSIGTQSALQASENIKLYQIVVGTILLMNIPIAYMLLKSKFPFYSVLLSSLVLEILAAIMRVFLLKKHINYPVKNYIKVVLIPVILPVIITLLFCLIWINFVHIEYRIYLTLLFSITIFIFSAYIFSFSKDEKLFFLSLFKTLRKK